jgi:hypothetical protein
MGVGFDQLTKDTPKVIRRARGAIIYTLAGSLPMSSEISSLIGIDAVRYGTLVGIAILITKGVSMFFGVEDESK